MLMSRAAFLRHLLSASMAVAFALVATLPGRSAHAQAERIIISGASGNLGGQTVKELLARGVPASRLILVSRTPDELKEYADQGASVRFGDFTKPESLPAAYAGGTRMLLISVGGSGEVTAAELLKRAIDAAKAAGVKHIAYTSYVGITRGDTAGRAADHQATEEALKASGVSWTMLRNSIYMHGQIGQAARWVADGRAVIPPNESPIGYITREDCARAAAAVLSTPGHENKAYDITGPELIGVRDAAAIAAAVTGKPIEVVQGGADTRPGFGRPAMAFTTSHFEDLTGRKPTSLRELFEANKTALLTPPAPRG
jgi:NAD(P)H dehydrogenase (quinone)